MTLIYRRDNFLKKYQTLSKGIYLNVYEDEDFGADF